MSSQTVARRYATALFDVADKHGGTDDALRDLAAFNQLILTHAELRHVLESRGVPPQKKHAIVAQILGTTVGASYVARLLLLLAERDRMALVPDIVAAFTVRMQQSRRILPADITTAVPLGAERKRALAAALGKATDGQVLLTEHVDASIIGGVIAKVGSVVFDASVTRQLERMRDALARQT